MSLRVVMDPGVFVSASLVDHGPLAEVVDAWHEGRLELIVFPLLLIELGEVLSRDKFAPQITPEDRDVLLGVLSDEATTVTDPEVVTGLTVDAKDDYLASLALACGATHLVTGDKGLAKWEHEDIAIVTPRTFLDILNASTER